MHDCRLSFQGSKEVIPKLVRHEFNFSPPQLTEHPRRAPYYHSLEGAGCEWRTPPSPAEECSLDGAARESEQFSDTLFSLMGQCSPPFGMSEAIHDRLVAADHGATTEKTHRRGAPHRHKRQFLEGEVKIQRRRELNNEASYLYRGRKKTNEQELHIQLQKLELNNDHLHNKYQKLEAVAQVYRKLHRDFQSYLPDAPPATSPLLPYTDHDALPHSSYDVWIQQTI